MIYNENVWWNIFWLILTNLWTTLCSYLKIVEGLLKICDQVLIFSMSPTVGSNKEWKPKPVICNVGLGSGAATASEVPTVSLEINAWSLPVSSVLDSEVATSKLQKKLEELHLPQRQHVIIPNHIHVPESERTKLSFGSFDASFGVALNYIGGQESDKSSTPLSEASQDADETAEEHGSRFVFVKCFQWI